MEVNTFCAEAFSFCSEDEARIKGIFITLASDLTPDVPRCVRLTQLLCVRVCEATGDAELKSIFLPPPSPLFFPPPPLPPSLCTSRLHLSLYVNHRSLSEASSQATFKHIEPCTSPLPFPPPALNLPALNLSPHTLSSFTLSRRFTLLPNFSPHTVAPPPLHLPLCISSASLRSLCNSRWSY